MRSKKGITVCKQNEGEKAKIHIAFSVRVMQHIKLDPQYHTKKNTCLYDTYRRRTEHPTMDVREVRWVGFFKIKILSLFKYRYVHGLNPTWLLSASPNDT